VFNKSVTNYIANNNNKIKFNINIFAKLEIILIHCFQWTLSRVSYRIVLFPMTLSDLEVPLLFDDLNENISLTANVYCTTHIIITKKIKNKKLKFPTDLHHTNVAANVYANYMFRFILGHPVER